MSDTLTIDFSEPIPLFPLQKCVLLPHATIPLHIFEPRYRQMVADALEGPQLIAMASFDGAEWESNYEGNPALRDHVCLGYIVKHEKLADGRYHIWLQGVCRARIVEEVSNLPYRLAILTPTEQQPPPMEIDLAEHRERLESLLTDPLLRDLTFISPIHKWLSSDVSTAALIDLVIMTTCDDPDRYDQLREPNINTRARWIERRLRDTRETIVTAAKFSPQEREDGISLN